jgi:hypothetical protein
VFTWLVDLWFSHLNKVGMTQQDHLLPDLTIDGFASQQFREISKWARFLSIVSFIGCAIIVILAVYLAVSFSGFSDVNRELGGAYATGYGFGIAIGYSIFAVIWFIPSLFLFQSAAKVRSGLDTTDQQLFNEGLTKLKACFRFWGVVTILILSFYALVLVFYLVKL